MVVLAQGDTHRDMVLLPCRTLAKVDHRPGEEEADEDVSLAPSVQVLFRGALSGE